MSGMVCFDILFREIKIKTKAKPKRKGKKKQRMTPTKKKKNKQKTKQTWKSMNEVTYKLPRKLHVFGVIIRSQRSLSAKTNINAMFTGFV